ncbi:MAG: carboxypeptidase regulatory-like domain-containing protein [Candidatus Kuenenia sp.]|nr:carboxypeptidase regulatory-like domain-containing protein [Candidatus Kuenenia hertensis]
MLRNYFIIICTILILLSTSNTAMASSGWVIYYESAFKGKVIDAETKEPIEGALVAAIYSVTVWGPLDSGSDSADVQETLTDSNGEFTTPGNIFFYFCPLTSGGEKTRFIIFKPGYGSYPGYNTFLIYPVHETVHIPEGRIVTGGKEVKTIKERDVHTEGIVFEKSIEHKEERKLYNEKFKGSSPFIPLENPFEKVRNLDLPFDADLMNAKELWTSRDHFERFPVREPFKSYALIGLPKVKTIEERKETVRNADRVPPRFKNKATIWRKMLKDEYDFIYKRAH